MTATPDQMLPSRGVPATDPPGTDPAAERATGSPARPSTETFVADHLRGVWRYLRMLGADAHAADDLTQETFVTALQKDVQRFDPPAAAVYLRRTARFAFLHHLRSRPADLELADAVDELWQQDCDGDGGDGLLAALRQCVGRLDGRARQAIERCYGIGAHDEVSRDAVAAALGLQTNGLKTLLQRTRQVLRACIETRARTHR